MPSQPLKLSPLLLLATALAPTFTAADTSCVQVPPERMPGACTVRVEWRKITHFSNDPESGKRRIQDHVAAEILDSGGTRISNEGIDNFIYCSGSGGRECKFQSKLPHEMIMSPQHRREYMQFYYGSMAWHTDPVPLQGPGYTGPNPQNSVPWCSVYTDWELLPPGSNNRYGPPYESNDISSVEKRSIECKFACGMATIMMEDLKPCVSAVMNTEPEAPVKTQMMTSMKTEIRYKTQAMPTTVTETQIRTLTVAADTHPAGVTYTPKINIETNMTDFDRSMGFGDPEMHDEDPEVRDDDDNDGADEPVNQFKFNTNVTDVGPVHEAEPSPPEEEGVWRRSRLMDYFL
ncbi:hypothetical protein TWF730_000176 [Orbilia blumenaviensis]|uniref:Uncharacterized protein n=1 Tax=Orbilia blumenaviensis TaxID=1796055 RepID=A0AAV9VKQ8_9PEZI